MRVNDKKSYLNYLNKLVDQCSNTYHHSINKKSINVDYSTLTEKIEINPKTRKFKLMLESELLRIGMFSVKVILRIGQDKYLLLRLF